MEDTDSLKVMRFLHAQQKLEAYGFGLENDGNSFSVYMRNRGDSEYVLFVCFHSVDELFAAMGVLCHDRLAEIAKRRKLAPKE